MDESASYGKHRKGQFRNLNIASLKKSKISIFLIPFQSGPSAARQFPPNKIIDQLFTNGTLDYDAEESDLGVGFRYNPNSAVQ